MTRSHTGPSIVGIKLTLPSSRVWAGASIEKQERVTCTGILKWRCNSWLVASHLTSTKQLTGHPCQILDSVNDLLVNSGLAPIVCAAIGSKIGLSFPIYDDRWRWPPCNNYLRLLGGESAGDKGGVDLTTQLGFCFDLRKRSSAGLRSLSDDSTGNDDAAV